MSSSTQNATEQGRFTVLAEHGMESALANPGFDRLMHLPASIFGVPIALISLVEAERPDNKILSGIAIHALTGKALRCKPG